MKKRKKENGLILKHDCLCSICRCYRRKVLLMKTSQTWPRLPILFKGKKPQESKIQDFISSEILSQWLKKIGTFVPKLIFPGFFLWLSYKDLKTDLKMMPISKSTKLKEILTEAAVHFICKQQEYKQ